jgi:hypothetical protein
MNITEFLLARIAEDEQQAMKHHESASRHGWGDYTCRVLAECEAKRAIIKQHEQWPVLVEHERPELAIAHEGLESITYRMTSEMAWLTTKEYIKRFGTEPPTAPMLLALAAVYRGHPDYREEWAA